MPAAAAPARRRRAAETPAPGEPEQMKTSSYTLPPSLIARMRAAQWHTLQRPDGHRNLSEMVRILVDREVDRLERKYNDGKPFPAVTRLPTGPSPDGAARGAELRALKRSHATQQEGGPKRSATRKNRTEGGTVEGR
ncbi:hypothetical protein [Streptomyces sp. NPDC047065]|uniref:ParB family protein n=1 Tax=Streptomyces sp. NPDC047065 TaxID=3154606 RepID=UPI00340AB562